MENSATQTNIMDRLRGGYEDACKVLNKKQLTLEQFAHLEEDAEWSFALYKIVTFLRALNEGIVWDWNSYDQDKHFPVWDMETYPNKPGSGFSLDGVGYDSTSTNVGARLVAGSEEHAAFAAEVMNPEYKIWIKG